VANVTINYRKFKSDINRFKSNIKRAIPKALNRSGEKTKEIILDRTSRGVGLNGAFKKYNPSYKDYRKKQGRSIKPDLNFSGRMLSNLDVEKVTTNKVLVTFKRKEEKKKAMQNQKTRPFMGVRPQEEKFIVNAFLKQFERDL